MDVRERALNIARKHPPAGVFPDEANRKRADGGHHGS
jgi:hypothetical protein